MSNPEVRIVKANEKSEGDGARVRRLFPVNRVGPVDPFVLMDEFFVDPPASFPEHPHRGFEAVTYMLDGGFIHKDSSGNEARVSEGGLQRITMGKGIKHSEAPVGEGTSHGIQLWVNLPKELKDINPGYEVVSGSRLQVSSSKRIREKVLLNGSIGPKLKTEVRYREIKVESGHFEWNPGREFSGFLYVLNGSGVAEIKGETKEISESFGVIEPAGEDHPVLVKTEDEISFIALSGRPHGEEIRLHGPFVD